MLDILTNSVNLLPLSDEKRAQVLEAAMELFIRHGFRRTTIGDIAEEAGMSRPAVYLVYPNKEEIFRGVVVKSCEEFQALCEKRVSAAESLEEKLRAVMETWVVDPYKLISRSPEAEELYEAAYSLASDVRKQGVKLFEEQLAEVIASSEEVDAKRMQKLGLKVKDVARLLALSTAELKRPVATLAELRRLLRTCIRIHAAVLTGQR